MAASKLTPEQRAEILALSMEGRLTLKAIAERYHVSVVTVSNIKRGMYQRGHKVTMA